MVAGHVTPEAQVGGPIAIVQDGDLISIDADHQRLSIELSEEEVSRRLTRWKAPTPRYTSGVIAKYAKLATSASEGAGTY